MRWRRSNLVDFLGGLTHAWRLHPVVCLHYLSVLALIVAYPVVILHNLVTGSFWDVIAFHLGVVALLGVVFLACALGWYGMSYARSWPLLIVVAGVGIVVRALTGGESRCRIRGEVEHE